MLMFGSSFMVPVFNNKTKNKTGQLLKLFVFAQVPFFFFLAEMVWVCVKVASLKVNTVKV